MILVCCCGSDDKCRDCSVARTRAARQWPKSIQIGIVYLANANANGIFATYKYNACIHLYHTKNVHIYNYNIYVTII